MPVLFLYNLMKNLTEFMLAEYILRASFALYCLEFLFSALKYIIEAKK